MTLEQDFIDCFVHTISWRARTGQDSFGNDTFSAAVDVACRVDSDETRLGGTDRQEQQSGTETRTLNLIMAVNAVTARDLFTFDSLEFIVDNVTVFRDEDGDHHQVVSATTDKKA